MNKINEFKYLKDWCDEYYKNVGLKIHPSNVPVDVILDDIMGHITMLIAHEKQFISWIDFTNAVLKQMKEKIESLEAQVHELNVAVVELERKTGFETLETAADIDKKRKKKND